MVYGWGESHDAHEKVYSDGGPKHEAKLSHELIAGAAAFEGFKLFEDRQRKQGKPVSHAFAKELLVGLAAGEVDKLLETKGRDYIDAERAKHHAKESAENMYDDHYVKHHEASEYNPSQYGPPERIGYENKS
ncbi:hypothetical protein GP486_004725 [Trichoglossum hirsutum]|uniref:CipC-like antibiotic response protein n=1 Tax=Trichoglossum hirsutum TaxID=265104 RepID=A0A9P8RNL0_9PEZI|nr:hypothetical protein GP486_004725 [Trichoglossum hirsutum]